MNLTIRREGCSWVVRDGTAFRSASGTWERAMNNADRIATHPARRRTRDAMIRIAIALGKMEARR